MHFTRKAVRFSLPTISTARNLLDKTLVPGKRGKASYLKEHSVNDLSAQILVSFASFSRALFNLGLI